MIWGKECFFNWLSLRSQMKSDLLARWSVITTNIYFVALSLTLVWSVISYFSSLTWVWASLCRIGSTWRAGRARGPCSRPSIRTVRASDSALFHLNIKIWILVKLNPDNQIQRLLLNDWSIILLRKCFKSEGSFFNESLFCYLGFSMAF
jgi:hypothetical protein